MKRNVTTSLKNHIKPLLSVSASKAIIALLSVATAALIAKFYGQEGLGVFALLRIIPAVFMVITDPGFSHSIPFLNGSKGINKNILVGSGLVFYFIVSFFQVSLWLAFSPLIQNYLLSSVSFGSVCLVSILVPLQSMIILLVNLLRSGLFYNYANGLFLLVEVSVLVLMLVSLGIFGPSIDSLVYILIVGSLIPLLIGLLLVFVFIVDGGIRLDIKVMYEGVRFGVKSQIGNAFQILNYRLDHLILGAFMTPEKVAVYFVATKSIEFFRFFTASIVFVFEPAFAKQLLTDARERVVKMLPPLTLINFVLLGVGVLLAPFFYPFVFGDWSSEANAPLLVLAAGLAISSSNSLYGAYFLGQGMPAVTTVASLAGLLVAAILSLSLIPYFGIMGAAYASSGTYIVVTLVYSFIFFRRGNEIKA